MPSFKNDELSEPINKFDKAITSIARSTRVLPPLTKSSHPPPDLAGSHGGTRELPMLDLGSLKPPLPDLWPNRLHQIRAPEAVVVISVVH